MFQRYTRHKLSWSSCVTAEMRRYVSFTQYFYWFYKISYNRDLRYSLKFVTTCLTIFGGVCFSLVINIATVLFSNAANQLYIIFTAAVFKVGLERKSKFFYFYDVDSRPTSLGSGFT
jgi:hypothetical protein